MIKYKYVNIGRRGNAPAYTVEQRDGLNQVYVRYKAYFRPEINSMLLYPEEVCVPNPDIKQSINVFDPDYECLNAEK